MSKKIGRQKWSKDGAWVDIYDDHLYIIDLCQSLEGVRYCTLREADSSPNKCMVLQTESFPGTLLEDPSVRARIETKIKLSNGQRFVRPTHLGWLTSDEWEYVRNHLMKERPDDPSGAPWVTEEVPVPFRDWDGT